MNIFYAIIQGIKDLKNRKKSKNLKIEKNRKNEQLKFLSWFQIVLLAATCMGQIL